MADKTPATRGEIDALERLVSAEIREIRQELPPLIEAAVQRAVRQTLTDPSVSRQVYDELSKHASDGLALWIGRRVLVFVAAMAVSATVAWAALTGKIK